MTATTYMHPDVLDNGLNTLVNASNAVLHLLPSLPGTKSDVTTNTLANFAGPSIGAPANSTSPAGRKVTVAAITGTSPGTVTANGTASHYAIVDGTRLLVAGPLSASQALTSGNEFKLAAFDVTLQYPA